MANANQIIYQDEDSLLDFDMSGALKRSDHAITAVTSIKFYAISSTGTVSSTEATGMSHANDAYSGKVVQANVTATTSASTGSYQVVVDVDTNYETSRIGKFFIVVASRT